MIIEITSYNEIKKYLEKCKNYEWAFAIDGYSIDENFHKLNAYDTKLFSLLLKIANPNIYYITIEINDNSHYVSFVADKWCNI